MFLHAFVTFCNVFADCRTTYGLSASYACGAAAWHCWARTSNSLKVCSVYINVDMLFDCFVCNAATDVCKIYFFWKDILIEIRNDHNWWVPKNRCYFFSAVMNVLSRVSGFTVKSPVLLTVQCLWKERERPFVWRICPFETCFFISSVFMGFFKIHEWHWTSWFWRPLWPICVLFHHLSFVGFFLSFRFCFEILCF